MITPGNAPSVNVADTVTQVAFDGPIAGLTAVSLGAMIAIAMLAVLWLERKILGRLCVLLFSLLRCAALAAICWMILQPTLVKRHSSTQSRSIAILADVSGSMDTIDHQLTSNMLPWVEPDHPETNAAQRAAVDLRFGAALIRANWLESPTLSDRAAEEVLARFDVTTQRCELNLQQLAQAAQSSRPLISQRANELLAGLLGSIADRQHLSAKTNVDPLADQSRFADRIVESFEQQAADLDAIVTKLHLDRTENPPTYTAKSRKQYMGNWLDRLEKNQLQSLTKGTQIKRAMFDANVRPLVGSDWSKQLSSAVAFDVQDGRTDLAAAVSWLGPTAVTDRLAAVFLISEGGHNADSKLSPTAASRALGGVPVLGIGIGNAMRSRDLILHHVNVPRIVSEDDDIKMEAIISAYDCQHSAAEVVLKRGSEEIERRKIQIDAAISDTRLQFRVPAGKPGVREFQIAIEPINGEVSEKNNYASFSVETIRGKTRVLLADLQTRWEYRYLQILFSRDKRVDADEFLQLPYQHATGQRAAQGRLPETIDEWAFYDVVILGDLELTAASATSLREYVQQRAGKLVVIAGKNHMPASYVGSSLFELFPIQTQPSKHQPVDSYIVVTQEGSLHPAIQIETTPRESSDRWRLASSRPSLGYVSPWTLPSASARVLATLATADPIATDTTAAWLCWHQVGAGQVVYITSPSVYKLRFRGGDTYHHRFWGQMLRWLMASDMASDQQLVQLRTDKSNYVQGDSIQVTAQLRTPQGFPESSGDVAVLVTPTSGEPQTVALREDRNLPGTYRAEIRNLNPEIYQLRAVGRSVQELVAASPDADPARTMITVEQVGDIERVLTSANYPLMAEIAAASGGQLVTPAAAEEFFSLLPLEEEVSTIEERTPIWNRWPLLCLVAGCLSTEWIIRKMKGLV